MKKISAILAAGGLSLAASTASACESLQDAMTTFEGVKDAYVAAAPNLRSDQFQIWAKHIQAFGDAMGKQNYAKACETLAVASAELGLDGGGGSGGSSTAGTGGTTTSGGGTSGPSTTGGATTAAAGTWTECPRGRCRN